MLTLPIFMGIMFTLNQQTQEKEMSNTPYYNIERAEIVKSSNVNNDKIIEILYEPRFVEWWDDATPNSLMDLIYYAVDYISSERPIVELVKTTTNQVIFNVIVDPTKWWDDDKTARTLKIKFVGQPA